MVLALSTQVTIIAVTLVLALVVVRDLTVIGTLSFRCLNLAKALAFAMLLATLLYLIGTKLSDGVIPRYSLGVS